jgi:hypothetical protein
LTPWQKLAICFNVSSLNMNATADSWKREPFTSGVAVPYRETFTAVELKHLRAGHVPEGMDDKWFVYFEAPHLFLHRSWTGKPVYRVELAVTEDGAEVVEALWSTLFPMSKGNEVEYQAALLRFLIAELLLGKNPPFPMPEGSGGTNPAIVRHQIAGIRHPKTPTDQ